MFQSHASVKTLSRNKDYYCCNNISLPTLQSEHKVKNRLYECKQQPNSISTKYEKTFFFKNFLIYCWYRWHLWLTFTFEIYPRISEKIEKARLGYSGARRKLIHGKKLKSKFSSKISPFYSVLFFQSTSNVFNVVFTQTFRGLSFWPTRLHTYIDRLAGTTSLRQSRLYLPSQGLRIWLLENDLTTECTYTYIIWYEYMKEKILLDKEQDNVVSSTHLQNLFPCK